MALTMKHIQSAIDHLGRLRPARLNLSAARDFSLREAILFMAPKLAEMKEMGFTTRELAAALAEQEIIIKAPTLNRYLSEYQAGREKGVAANEAMAESLLNQAEPRGEALNVSADVFGISESDPPSRSKPFTALSAE